MKKVIKYSLDGEVISVYDSVTEAAKENNTNKTNISNACINKTIRCGNYAYRCKDDTYIKRHQQFRKNTVEIYKDGSLLKSFNGYGNASSFFGLAKDTFQCIVRGRRNSPKIKGYIIKIKDKNNELKHIIDRTD